MASDLSSLRSLLQRRATRLPATEADAALAAARESIEAHLSLQGLSAVSDSGASNVYETPGTNVDESPLPWLLRRLDAALHDASLTGRAAREAMSELARPRGLVG